MKYLDECGGRPQSFLDSTCQKCGHPVVSSSGTCNRLIEVYAGELMSDEIQEEIKRLKHESQFCHTCKGDGTRTGCAGSGKCLACDGTGRLPEVHYRAIKTDDLVSQIEALKERTRIAEALVCRFNSQAKEQEEHVQAGDEAPMIALCIAEWDQVRAIVARISTPPGE